MRNGNRFYLFFDGLFLNCLQQALGAEATSWNS